MSIIQNHVKTRANNLTDCSLIELRVEPIHIPHKTNHFVQHNVHDVSFSLNFADTIHLESSENIL